MGKAQSARHATVEFSPLKPQESGWFAHSCSTDRPGLKRRSGSKSSRTRRLRAATPAETGGGSGSGRSQWTTPTPISATNRPVSPESLHRSLGRRDQRYGGSSGEVGTDAGSRARSSSTSTWCPQSRAHTDDPSQRIADAVFAVLSTVSGSASANFTHCSCSGLGRVRRIASPMHPSVPNEPTRTRHMSKPVTFLTVGPPAVTSRPSAAT